MMLNSTSQFLCSQLFGNFLKSIAQKTTNNNLILKYQFGLVKKQSTIDRVPRITDIIKPVLEERYCSAVFQEVLHRRSIKYGLKAIYINLSKYFQTNS